MEPAILCNWYCGLDNFPRESKIVIDDILSLSDSCHAIGGVYFPRSKKIPLSPHCEIKWSDLRRSNDKIFPPRKLKFEPKNKSIAEPVILYSQGKYYRIESDKWNFLNNLMKKEKKSGEKIWDFLPFVCNNDMFDSWVRKLILLFDNELSKEFYGEMSENFRILEINSDDSDESI